MADVPKCRTAFSLAADVPSCSGTRDGSCLTDTQKTVLAKVFAGARDSAGTTIYSSFPFDAGINGANWRAWKFANSQVLDTGAVGFVFSTPAPGPEPALGHRLRPGVQHGRRRAEHLRGQRQLHRNPP